MEQNGDDFTPALGCAEVCGTHTCNMHAPMAARPLNDDPCTTSLAKQGRKVETALPNTGIACQAPKTSGFRIRSKGTSVGKMLKIFTAKI